MPARRINIGCAYLILLFAAVLCVAFLRYGSAFKVGNAALIQSLVLAGFLTIPCSGLPEAAAEVKRYAPRNGDRNDR